MKHAAVRLSPGAQACLVGYAWPGNVRELDNAIQRALILQQGGVIQAEDFCLVGPIACAPLPVMRVPLVEADASEMAVAESAGALGDDLRRREFQMIIDTLRAERGRRKEAAQRLGISPRTLRYKLAQMRDAGMDVEARPICSPLESLYPLYADVSDFIRRRQGDGTLVANTISNRCMSVKKLQVAGESRS